jgi:hypothetical protein
MIAFIGFKVILEREIARKIEKLAEKGIFRSLGNAAASVRSTARKFIKRRKGASPEGEPPHTRKGKAKRADAVLFSVDKNRDTAFIGFMEPVLGMSMSAHEHGGTFLGQEFPQRPTLGPALLANQVRFGNEFRAILGS